LYEPERWHERGWLLLEFFSLARLERRTRRSVLSAAALQIETKLGKSTYLSRFDLPIEKRELSVEIYRSFTRWSNYLG
jgi:hypothetical protein